MQPHEIANDALIGFNRNNSREHGMREAIVRADNLSGRDKKPIDAEVIKSALMAYDASEEMNREHIACGILPREASKNFSMQAAITAANEHRDTGCATIYVRDDGSFPSEN